MASRHVPIPPSRADYLLRPFQRFMASEAAGGILLLICAVLAMIWANSPWSASYFALWNTPVELVLGPLYLDKTLLLIINDGLMAIFFFLVGLEIKREILVGELRDPKKALLTICAALGGMVAPALIYALLNAGRPTISGWGVPMATDIAFAIGVLALLGSRAPLALKVFLTALAIVDDLGAVLVIAIFYTSQVSLTALGIGALFLATLFAMNRLGVQRTAVYVLLGIGLWLCILKSGVHATVAGVLLALTVPAVRRIDAPSFLKHARYYLKEVEEDQQPGAVVPTEDQRDAIQSLNVLTQAAETPLARMEHALHGWVAFFIMPIFALANAGVAVTGDIGTLIGSPVALGVMLGLFFGKQIGVFGFSWLAVKLGIARLPEGIRWAQIYGVSLLTGIGFTMAIFIANLAFVGLDPLALDSAKLGILLASTVAGLVGYFTLRAMAKSPEVGGPNTLDERAKVPAPH